jgi:glycosyltransferase involved in cell wall biosynthesis
MNLHLYPSPFTNESRILREVGGILNLGLAESVVVAGVEGPDLPSYAPIIAGAELIRFPLWSSYLGLGKIGQALGLLEYLIRTFMWGFRKKPETVNCHSLNVLLVGVILKWLGRTRRLIYDAHELETERATLSGFPKKVSKWAERLLIYHCDHVQVVCEPIAQWYRVAYPGITISVVRNVPSRQIDNGKSNLFREKFDIGKDDLIFIYQGVLSSKRGIKLLIETFAKAGPSRHIVFMGYGPMESDVKLAADQNHNIHFQPSVPPSEIHKYTLAADLGIVVVEGDQSLSYRLALPNKFFEYVHGSCAVLVSDNLNYLAELTQHNNLGWTTQATVSALLKKISLITKENVSTKLAALRSYGEENCWENEEAKLTQAFGIHDLLGDK